MLPGVRLMGTAVAALAMGGCVRVGYLSRYGDAVSCHRGVHTAARASP
jgi:hypothetical protein